VKNGSPPGRGNESRTGRAPVPTNAHFPSPHARKTRGRWSLIRAAGWSTAYVTKIQFSKTIDRRRTGNRETRRVPLFIVLHMCSVCERLCPLIQFCPVIRAAARKLIPTRAGHHESSVQKDTSSRATLKVPATLLLLAKMSVMMLRRTCLYSTRPAAHFRDGRSLGIVIFVEHVNGTDRHHDKHAATKAYPA
jgi:hypothetical protein